jgi:hypothetical protein
MHARRRHQSLHGCARQRRNSACCTIRPTERAVASRIEPPSVAGWYRRTDGQQQGRIGRHMSTAKEGERPPPDGSLGSVQERSRGKAMDMMSSTRCQTWRAGCCLTVRSLFAHRGAACASSPMRQLFTGCMSRWISLATSAANPLRSTITPL